MNTSGGSLGMEFVSYSTIGLLICLGFGFQVFFNPEVRLIVDITEGSLRSHNHFLLFNWGSQSYPFIDVNKIYLTQNPDQIWSVEVNVGDKDRPLADISNERDARLLSQTLARVIKAELLEREAPVEVEHAAG